ncbi:unnamed protein product [Sympodiomycopsis kandeliae]
MTNLLKTSLLTQVKECLPKVTDLWFEGVPANATMPSDAALSRWWGKGRSAEENAKFNNHCRSQFGSVLDNLATLPVSTDSRQIVQELESSTVYNSQEKRDVYHSSLGLILLLDQMPRCMLGASNPKVYSHYDILAQLIAKNALDKGVDAYFNQDSLAWRFWFYLPLEHSEDIQQHDRTHKFLEEFAAKQKERGENMMYTSYSQKSSTEHRDIVKQFGRYPYRNVVLGRKSTDEEGKWIKENGNPFATA